MKDYYKILGVEEEASADEIRARWTELIKQYHPDLWRTDAEDERIKEINEAYEILKNESTRFHYDLERALKRSIIKKASRPGERRMSIRRIILPAGMVVLFLIVGLISLTWFHVGAPPKPKVPEEREQVPGRKTAPEIPPVKTESEVQGDLEIPKENSKKGAIPQERKEIVSVSPQRSPQKILPKSIAPLKVEEKVAAKEEPKPVEEPVPKVAAKSEPLVSVEKEVAKEVAREAPKEVPKEVPKEISREVSKEVAREAPKEPPRAVLHPGKKLVVSPPLPLVREKEVKQFFSSYIDQYRRRDIDGFLSFFSSKAIQNQKDGFNGIKNIYTKFFGQSRELRYHVEGMKTEIYQNAVDVKARFRVDQTLKRGGEQKVWTGTIHWVLVKEDGALKIISLDYQNEKSP